MSREDGDAEEFRGYAMGTEDPQRGQYAIAYALLLLASATDRVATQLKYLGTGDAATMMGAIEFLATHLGEQIKEAAQLIPVRED